jgi:predicted DCC family thiol-disulfide oxidoreductase YuxK
MEETLVNIGRLTEQLRSGRAVAGNDAAMLIWHRLGATWREIIAASTVAEPGARRPCFGVYGSKS